MIERQLWLEDSGLRTDLAIKEALTPAYDLLRAAGVTPSEAHAEMIALLDAGDQDAIYDCLWMRAERAVMAATDLPEAAVMALG